MTGIFVGIVMFAVGFVVGRWPVAGLEEDLRALRAHARLRYIVRGPTS